MHATEPQQGCTMLSIGWSLELGMAGMLLWWPQMKHCMQRALPGPLGDVEQSPCL